VQSIAVRQDSGDGAAVIGLGRAYSSGDHPDGPDPAASIATLVAVLVFVLAGGLTALATVAARDVLKLAVPQAILLLFGVTGLLLSATAALALRRFIVQQTHEAVAAEAAPREPSCCMPCWINSTKALPYGTETTIWCCAIRLIAIFLAGSDAICTKAPSLTMCCRRRWRRQMFPTPPPGPGSNNANNATGSAASLNDGWWMGGNTKPLIGKALAVAP